MQGSPFQWCDNTCMQTMHPQSIEWTINIVLINTQVKYLLTKLRSALKRKRIASDNYIWYKSTIEFMYQGLVIDLSACPYGKHHFPSCTTDVVKTAVASCGQAFQRSTLIQVIICTVDLVECLHSILSLLSIRLASWFCLWAKHDAKICLSKHSDRPGVTIKQIHLVIVMLAWWENKTQHLSPVTVDEYLQQQKQPLWNLYCEFLDFMSSVNFRQYILATDGIDFRYPDVPPWDPIYVRSPCPDVKGNLLKKVTNAELERLRSHCRQIRSSLTCVHRKAAPLPDSIN